MNNVFKCPCCFHSYTTETRPPINLECGDVLCLPCIQSLTSSSNDFTCPLDNKCFKINSNSLTTCKAILDFLPVKSSMNNHFYCKTHPHKKVKYSCEIDNNAFCSLCLVNHKKHQITSFRPLKQMLNEQMVTLLNAVNDKKESLTQHKKSFYQSKTVLGQKMMEQLSYIQQSTEKIINELINQSKEFQGIIKERYQVKLKSIDELIIENEKYAAFVTGMEHNVLLCQETITNQSKTIYDDFIEKRRGLLRNWEEFIFDYNKTKIALRDKIIFDEERFVIQWNKTSHIFMFSNKQKKMNTIDVNDHDDIDNDDNKENTPMKMRNFIAKRIIHTNTQSTIANTNMNTFTMKYQTQKGNLPNSRLNLSNQPTIMKLNSL